MCEEEKENMKGLPEGELGSWSWAVVTSDGVWQTRGHFSKNGSFIINPLTFLLFSVFLGSDIKTVTAVVH